MFKNSIRIGSMLTAGAVFCSALIAQEVNVASVSCETGLCRLTDTQVPLKVLPRPFSTLYSDKGETVVDSTIPAFAPMYVFERDGVEQDNADSRKGWYQVGETTKEPNGWISADDVVEWHNSLILSYTPVGIDEEKRNRVVGFSTIEDLENFALDDERETKAQTLLAEIDAREPGSTVSQDIIDSGVVSAEPQGVYRDINDAFYMWPILSWATSDHDPDERFVEFIQLVPECRQTDEPKTDTADVAGYLQGESTGKKKVEAADVIFVVDTTGSMEPYIEAVKAGISDAVETLNEASGSIRFGFVGFQDDFEELDYIAKDFFPEGLVDASTFLSTVESEVKVEEWGQHMIPERMFDGFDTAINAQWRDDSIKFVIAVSDAPAIPSDDGDPPQPVPEDYILLEADEPQRFDQLVEASVGQAGALGRRARDGNVQVMSIFINPGKHENLSTVASKQMDALVQNQNTTEGFVTLDGASGTVSGFDSAITDLVTTIAKAMGAESLGDISDTVEDTSEPTESEELPAETLLKAAVMEHLGATTPEDCDYRGWVSDRDLAESAVRALDVNVLLTHDQFDTLYRTVKDIHAALATADITGLQFIDALKSVGTITVADPEAIERAKTGGLASSGLLPRWLESLPYKSDIAVLSAEDIDLLSAAERTQISVSVGNKISRFQTVIEDNDMWHTINGNDEGDIKSRVAPIPLDDLP